MPPRRSRREVLRALGATALVAPFAQTWALRRARARPQPRVMFVYVPDGCIPDQWHPSGAEDSFVLGPMTAPLASVQQHLVFIDGLTMYGGAGHHEGGIVKVLTGGAPMSLDIYLGQRLGPAPHRSIHLGIGATLQAQYPSMSFMAKDVPMMPNDDPLGAFDHVFGQSALTSLEERQRASVLDEMVSQLESLKQQVGSSEREKLDEHLTSLRELERRAVDQAAESSRECGGRGFNPDGFAVLDGDFYPTTYHKEQNLRVVGELQMDLAVRALSCGATNVVTLSWSHTVSPMRILETGIKQIHHDVSHYGDPSSPDAQSFVVMKCWLMERFASLIQKLADTPDGDGTLLDNTLVVLVSEVGDSYRHDHDRVPFVLAGRAGGALKTGRLLDYRGKNQGKNEDHTKLLVSIANMVGVATDSYGTSGTTQGGLPGLQA